MDTKKVVPISIAVIILIIGLFIFTKNNRKEKGYQSMTISYNQNSKNYAKKDIYVGLKIDSISAEIIAIEGNKIVIRANDGNDVEIKLNEEKKICKSNDDCALVMLKG